MCEKLYRSTIYMGSMIVTHFRFRDIFQIYPAQIVSTTEHGHPVIIEYNDRYRLVTDKEERTNAFGDGYGHLDLLHELIALVQLITNCPCWIPSGDQLRPGIQEKIKEFSTHDPRLSMRFSKTRILNRINAGPESVSLQLQSEDLLDSYFRMDTDSRTRINASLFLYQQMRRIILKSASMGFVGLISAIENLVAFEGERQEFEVLTCKSCGQPRYSVTRRFRDFMEFYSEENFITENDADGFYIKEEEFGVTARKLISDFYQLRSKIAHAGQILEMDRTLSGFQAKEIRLFNEVEALTRIALFSYILKFDAKSTESDSTM